MDKTIIAEASLGRSKDLQISHARLPIAEHCPECGIKILNIDTVIEILQSVRDGATWREAFLKAIPKRGLKKK